MDIQNLDIDKIARLANISLTSDEQQAFFKDLAELLSFFESIKNTDTMETLEPDVSDAFRRDEPISEIGFKELFGNASSLSDGCITVPQVMEDL